MRDSTLDGRAARVVRLWRYPVKSMLGEEREQLTLTRRGVDGDRFFAVRDARGKLGSGKTTRRFRQIDGLLAFRASYEDDRPAIVFPDGRRLGGRDPSIHASLSEALGMPVTLAREADVSHLDAGPVHLLTTAALAWLEARLGGAPIDPRRFRPNVLVRTPGDSQIEQGWLGRTLSVGPEVELRVTALTERCVMVGLPQTALPDDPRILRSIAHGADACFGVYAEVLRPGTIHRDDSVTVSDA
jgi:uncharacterized protein